MVGNMQPAFTLSDGRRGSFISLGRHQPLTIHILNRVDVRFKLLVWSGRVDETVQRGALPWQNHNSMKNIFAASRLAAKKDSCEANVLLPPKSAAMCVVEEIPPTRCAQTHAGTASSYRPGNN